MEVMDHDDLPAVPPPGASAPHAEVRVWIPPAGRGAICQEGRPPAACAAALASEGPPQLLRVLTYNLFWWNAFGPHYQQRHPQGNGITALLARASGLGPGAAAAPPHDVLGFQECVDGDFLLDRAGLANDYAIFRARQCCMAYRKTSWTLLDSGSGYVATDVQYGLRIAQWMRLKHKGTNRVMLFVNHHGPMPVNSGGVCGMGSTVYQLAKLIQNRAQCGDVVILVGDFNAGPASTTVLGLRQCFTTVYSGESLGLRLDYVFSNLPASAVNLTQDLGSAGSDHNAISVTFKVGRGPLPTPAPADPQVAAGAGCVKAGDDPHASGAERRCCPDLKKCLRQDLGWRFRCQSCNDTCPDEHDFVGRACEAAAVMAPQPSPSSAICTLLDHDPNEHGSGQRCCPGLKSCLRADLGWQFRCQRCNGTCQDDKDFAGRKCE